MRILISNDDGYKAGGIHALARIMAEFGEVTVVAPKYHQSAMSMAVSLGMKRLAHKALPEEGPGNPRKAPEIGIIWTRRRLPA